MNILFADDAKIHQDRFISTITDASAELSIPLTIIKVVDDGKKLFEAYVEATKSQKIDIVFSDIRMPVEDGLTALVRIRNANPQQKMIMVSSETATKMTLALHEHGLSQNKDLELSKKLEMLAKVADRIRSGKIEEGKINQILEGCEKLALDPIIAAEALGAGGYLQKPYDQGKIKTLLQTLSTSQSFLLVS